MTVKQSKKNQKLNFLPDDFVPSRLEVVVGRGKKCTDHTGNQRMRSIVRSRIQEYSTANDKTHKTYIISQIFHEIRNSSSCGGFVKKDPETGRWYRVADPTARTNIAQSFRDELHDTYRSSKFAKQRRRWGSHVAAANQSAPTVVMPKSDDEEQKAPVHPKLSVPSTTSKMQGPASSVKSMVYPTLINQDHALKEQGQSSPFACPSSVASYIRSTSTGSAAIADILSSALNVVCAEDALPQLALDHPPAASTSTKNDMDTFDALLSLTGATTENPYEPTPIAGGLFGAV